MNGKAMLKAIIAAGWSRFERLAPGRAPKLTILYYHAVARAEADQFGRQMAELRRSANVVRCDYAGALDPDRPNVAVTFDDAFRSIRENALPALIAHRIPATVFVPSGWLGRSPGWAMETSGDQDETVMTADELAALPAEWLSIGSHTVSHPRLSRLLEKDLRTELTESRASLSRIANAPVDLLAFPYGDHDDTTIARAGDAGYRHVFTVAPQALHQSLLTGIARGRTSVDPSDPLPIFRLKMRGAYDWMPQASRIKRRFRRR